MCQCHDQERRRRLWSYVEQQTEQYLFVGCVLVKLFAVAEALNNIKAVRLPINPFASVSPRVQTSKHRWICPDEAR